MFSYKKWLPVGTRTSSSGIIIFTILVILVTLKIFYPSASRIASFEGDSQREFDKLVEKESSSIDDSLPHYLYKQRQDSIRHELSKYSLGGNSWHAFDLGVEKLESEKGQKRYYFQIGGYYIKEGFSDFYSLRGKNYIQYTVFTKEEDDVKFGYARTFETDLKLEQRDEREWKVSYPVSKTGYTVWQAILIVLTIIILVLFFGAIIGLPLQLLSLIAQGRAFSEKVIAILYTQARILILAGVLRALLRISLHLYYKAQIPPSVTFYYYDDIMSGWGLIVGGLVALLFAKAFRKGYELEQEQELTV